MNVSSLGSGSEALHSEVFISSSPAGALGGERTIAVSIASIVLTRSLPVVAAAKRHDGIMSSTPVCLVGGSLALPCLETTDLSDFWLNLDTA